jgi:hypothetical protein
MVAAGDRTLAARRPDPPQDRLQPEAVFVGGEDLYDLAGMARGFLGGKVAKPFFNTPCSSGTMSPSFF